MDAQKIVLWGAADLRDFSTPQDETGHGFSFALSWGIPMKPQIMVSIQDGPNQTYAEEYARVNNRINELSGAIAAEIKGKGFRAKPLAASDRTNAVNIRGDFPHKTAATRAGLGWVGRFVDLDENKDGKLSRDEYISRMKAMAKIMDLDGDGVITVEEYSISWIGKEKADGKEKKPAAEKSPAKK